MYKKNIGNNGSLISSYILDTNEKLPLIIVCPGGGYSHLSPREGEPISQMYNSLGYHSAVLEYCHGPENPMYNALVDLAQTILYFREIADGKNIDKNRIYLCGFSAGGHLIASMGLAWNNSKLIKELNTSAEELMPNGLILCYPVIDLNETNNCVDITENFIPEKYINPNLPNNQHISYNKDRIYFNPQVNMNALICGEYMTEKLMKKYSISCNITSNMPKTFIWHGGQDDSIYIQNSINYMNAMNRANVSCELHIFSSGIHGCSLGTEVTAAEMRHVDAGCSQWVSLVANWIERDIKEERNEKY